MFVPHEPVPGRERGFYWSAFTPKPCLTLPIASTPPQLSEFFSLFQVLMIYTNIYFTRTNLVERRCADT